MAIKDLLLPEFDQEMATTRRFLERYPVDHLDWRPHAKSQTLQALVSHLANIPHWVPLTLEQDTLDLMPEGKPWTTPQVKTVEEALASFDAGVKAARASLERATDACMGDIWTLTGGGQVFFQAPKGATLRGFVFNHLVHHRAQLGLYYRLLDLPVPSAYGPTADEGGMA